MNSYTTSTPTPFKRRPVHSHLSLPHDVFLHLVSILDTPRHRGTLATMLRTSQDMYTLLAPIVYSTVELSKRVEEGLFKGVWGSPPKKDEVQDVSMSRYTGGMMGKMLRRIGQAKQIMSSDSTTSSDSPLNSRKHHLFTHTKTLVIDSLPSKEMIYRLYDLSLVRPALFPNLHHLIISGEVAWQWETNPTYQRGKDAFLAAFNRFTSVNKICIHYSRLTVGRDQYLNIYPVYQTGMNTEILGPYPQRTPAKEIRMDLSWIPPVDLCVHGVVTQMVKIPPQARTVRLAFEPCLCVQRGAGVTCLDHLGVEERRAQVLAILVDAFGEARDLDVEIVGMERVGTAREQSVEAGLREGMIQAGLPLEKVTFMEEPGCRGCHDMRTGTRRL